MIFAITFISIFSLAFLAWLVRKFVGLPVCPVCVGVCLTWIGLLTAKYFGYPIDALIPAVLMGGSVVGMAYQIEKRMSETFSPVVMKILFIPVGFFVVYSVLSGWWIAILGGVLVLASIALYFLYSRDSGHKKSSTAAALEKKMDHCC